jgi:hypothetical protein
MEKGIGGELGVPSTAFAVDTAKYVRSNTSFSKMGFPKRETHKNKFRIRGCILSSQIYGC